MNTKEYLLVKAMEECNELAQRFSKALAFGVDDDYTGKSANTHIYDELGDLLGVIELLEDEHILTHENVHDRRYAKKAKVREFMEYSRNKGTLKDDNDGYKLEGFEWKRKI